MTGAERPRISSTRRNYAARFSTKSRNRQPEAANATYLCWWINSSWGREWASRVKTDGVSQSNINGTKLGEMPVPIAPLPEQRRIVEKVEALLEQVNRARTRLQRVPLILKRFRQAVLAAACSGELTREWRELADGPAWTTRTLGSIIAHLDQGWSPQCANHPAATTDAWAVIKTTAVQPMSFLPAENKELLPGSEPRPHLVLHADDLLITRAGPRARAGICCRVQADTPKLMICDKVYRFRVNKGLVRPRLVELVLNEPARQSEIDDLKTGISDSGVNLTQEKFKALAVGVPPLEEQDEIVRQVDRLFALADTIERRVQAGTTRADKLPQAILSKAFSGELVPTEAELARAEERTYETAEVLLARAQFKREAAMPKKPRGRSR